MTQIYSICLSGGPCGGKTTALPRMHEFFTQRGLASMTVPEAATLVFGNGYDPREKMDDGGAFLQDQIIRLQIAVEDQWKDLIHSTGAKEGVLLCDRGVMDGPAFTTPDAWRRILDTHGWSESALHRRYAAIIHMVTAADGAERFFGNASNPVRKEDPERARQFDQALQQAWSGHKRFIKIDNGYTDFDAKLDAATNAAWDVIESERKKPND